MQQGNQQNKETCLCLWKTPLLSLGSLRPWLFLMLLEANSTGSRELRISAKQLAAPAGSAPLRVLSSCSQQHQDAQAEGADDAQGKGSLRDAGTRTGRQQMAKAGQSSGMPKAANQEIPRLV